MVTEASLNRIVLTEHDCIELLLTGKSLDGAYVNDSNVVEEYNDANDEYFGLDAMLRNVNSDQDNVNTWLIPDKYKCINVKQFVLDKANTQAELDRVELEYRMYKERNLIDILRCMIFLIDYFRENNIVWGVGRGSSVSSYILYLIGVHKIDSLKYNLPIEEFLK